MSEEIDKGGRPPLFSTSEDLQNAVDGYFEYVKGEVDGEEIIRYPENITITGLAVFLGFESRQSIYDYEKDGKFSYIIKKARLKVEQSYENRLHSNTPTGAIFALKNMGWKDKTETEHSGEMTVKNITGMEVK